MNILHSIAKYLSMAVFFLLGIAVETFLCHLAGAPSNIDTFLGMVWGFYCGWNLWTYLAWFDRTFKKNA